MRPGYRAHEFFIFFFDGLLLVDCYRVKTEIMVQAGKKVRFIPIKIGAELAWVLAEGFNDERAQFKCYIVVGLVKTFEEGTKARKIFGFWPGIGASEEALVKRK